MFKGLSTNINKRNYPLLGKQEIPVCVLNNKKRVIVQRELVYLLTGNRKGGLDRYTKAQGIRQFMPKKYVDQSHKDVVLKFSIGSNIAYGYEATDMIDICDAYLKAKENRTTNRI